MRYRPRRTLAIASAVAALALILSPAASAQEPCRLTPIGTAQVAAVRDGRTLLLADGRELRLAAIEAPDASRAGLQSLVSGQTLRLEALGADHDRYGRLVALAFAGEDTQSVQQAMLTAGLARVSARAGGRALRGAALERRAQSARGKSRPLGRSKFRPFAGGKCRPVTQEAGPVRVSRRQGLVGAP